MNDDELLDELRLAVEAADQPPTGLRDSALRAHSWDRDMALMIASSGAPLVRTAGAQRGFVFQLEGCEIYFSIEEISDDRVRVFGGVVPGVDLVTIYPIDGQAIGASTDENSRFDELVGARTFSLGFVNAAGTQMRTPVISSSD